MEVDPKTGSGPKPEEDPKTGSRPMGLLQCFGGYQEVDPKMKYTQVSWPVMGTLY